MMTRVILILALLFPLGAWASEQVLVNGGVGTLSPAGGTKYSTLMGGEIWLSSEGGAACRPAIDGTLKFLHVELGTAPGSGASWTFSMANMVGEPSCTISGTETSCSDTTTQGRINSTGLSVAFEAVPSNTPNSTAARWVMVFDSASPDRSWFCGASSDSPSNSADNFAPLAGRFQTFQSTEDLGSIVMPVDGHFKNFRVAVNGSPNSGTSGAFYDVTIRKNGADTSLTCRLEGSGAGDSCEDQTNSVGVSAGDRIGVEWSPSGTPSALTSISMGLGFTASTTGGFVLPIAGGTSQPTSATGYRQVFSGDADNNSTESDAQQLSHLLELKTMYVHLDTNPGGAGGGAKYTFTGRLDGADTDLTCFIASSGTSCSDTTGATFSPIKSLLSTKIVPAGGFGAPSNAVVPKISFLAVASTSQATVWID